MDESTLETAIKQYQDQLIQIETAFQTAAGDMKNDLGKLKADLQQLIQLTQENLLTVKKKRLLEEVENDANLLSNLDQSKVNIILGTNQIAESVDLPQTSSAGGNYDAENEDILAEDLTALVGSKCRAPFSQEWGEYSHHNAVILGVEPLESIETSNDILVRVMFCNPLHSSMKPCPYFLDGNCRFSDEACRYSHGQIVSLDKLKEFELPDFRLLQRDRSCLAQRQDGLWYKATIEDVMDNHRFTVKFDITGEEINVELEQIMPWGDEKMDDEDRSPEQSYEYGIEPQNSMELDTSTPTSGWYSQDQVSSEGLGNWEQFTKGIGSKLMAKMGYVFGQGLGRNSEGRIDPVEAVVLPAGISLDTWMMMRDKEGAKNPIRKLKKLEKIRKKQATAIASRYNPPNPTNVFDFLNKKLATGKGKDERDRRPAPALKTIPVQHLNVELLRLGEDISKTERQLSHLQAALKRNEDDRLVHAQLMHKIEDAQHHLQTLKKGELTIHKEQNIRKHNRKLTIF